MYYSTVPAPLGNTGADRALQEGRISYLQVQIPDGGITLAIDVDDGRVLVCGSRVNQNPNCRDSSTYDWICETEGYCDVFVSNSNSRKRRQDATDIMFITIEGVDKNNEVSVDIMMGDETISNGNSYSYKFHFNACILRKTKCSNHFWS